MQPIDRAQGSGTGNSETRKSDPTERIPHAQEASEFVAGPASYEKVRGLRRIQFFVEDFVIALFVACVIISFF